MSWTVVNYPIVAALEAVGNIPGMGKNRLWTAANERQKHFLHTIFDRCRAESPLIPEIESIASYDVALVNEFLKDHGFDIQLDQADFAVASVLDVLVKWLIKGTRTKVEGIDRKIYPAANMADDTVRFLAPRHHSHPIAQVLTQNNDEVFMTLVESAPRGSDELSAMVREISEGAYATGGDFSGLIFPMVDLNQEVDISWLVGLRTLGSDGRPAVITQALQQTILKLNHIGARAKSAVAFGLERFGGSSHPPFVINKPFLFWIKRPGLSEPFIEAYLTLEVWKDPGEL